MNISLSKKRGFYIEKNNKTKNRKATFYRRGNS